MVSNIVVDDTDTQHIAYAGPSDWTLLTGSSRQWESTVHSTRTYGAAASLRFLGKSDNASHGGIKNQRILQGVGLRCMAQSQLGRAPSPSTSSLTVDPRPELRGHQVQATFTTMFFMSHLCCKPTPRTLLFLSTEASQQTRVFNLTESSY